MLVTDRRQREVEKALQGESGTKDLQTALKICLCAYSSAASEAERTAETICT